eukprot:g18513.t1
MVPAHNPKEKPLPVKLPSRATALILDTLDSAENKALARKCLASVILSHCVREDHIQMGRIVGRRDYKQKPRPGGTCTQLGCDGELESYYGGSMTALQCSSCGARISAEDIGNNYTEF